ncbi:hypothetical protein CAPTEDRAFT_215888 [Capitella teleta]|uniref:Uncharacterized protein n=1 Tax=Capitella teleta TaxID=283909 RepID=R7U7Q3_CAPTE|nr:hypothetical protein CAPTEDRAFT_215888 [Capitella teleta]|eukprot:ELT99165.1 hypothetical protein CAPTEDRAFT_215888 [Capitella teleta]
MKKSVSLFRLFVFIYFIAPFYCETYLERLREEVSGVNLSAALVFPDSTIQVNYNPASSMFQVLLEGSNCTISGSLSSGALEVHRAALELSLDSSPTTYNWDSDESADLYHIRLQINDDEGGEASGVVVGLAAVKPSAESRYKFLPFVMEDLYYVTQFMALPRIAEASSLDVLPINITMPSRCLRSVGNGVLHVTEVEEKSLDVLKAALFLLVTYNPNWKSEEKFAICSTAYDVHRDAPFVLRECCSARPGNIFHRRRRDLHLDCHDANRARTALSHTVATLGCIATLFAPLLIKFAVVYYDKEEYPDTGSGYPRNPIRKFRAFRMQVRFLRSSKRRSRETKVDDEASVDCVPLREKASTNHSSQVKNLSDECSEDEEACVYLDTLAVHELSVWRMTSAAVSRLTNQRPVLLCFRYFLLFCIWEHMCVVTFVSYVYYDSIFEHPVFAFQKNVLTTIFDSMTVDYPNFLPMPPRHLFIWIVVLIVPASIAIVHMFTLFHVYIFSKELAEPFYWNNSCTIMGVAIPCKLDQVMGGQSITSALKRFPNRSPYSELVFRNMIHNLNHLRSKEFWVTWWNTFVCCFSPVLHIKPLRYRRRWYSYLQVLVLPFTLPNILVFDTFLLLSNVLLFLSVDVLRNSESSLSRAIFVFSILGYVRKAFTDFDERYRHLKVKTFEVAMNLEEKICDTISPFKSHAFVTLLKLLLCIALVLALFLIAVEFQIFHEFTLIGETVLTVLTPKTKYDICASAIKRIQQALSAASVPFTHRQR